MLGTRKKQTIPASRASRLVHPQAMGTILVPHSNTSISYHGGPCIAICIVSWKSSGSVAALLSESLSNHSLRASSPGGRMLANFSGLVPSVNPKGKARVIRGLVSINYVAMSKDMEKGFHNCII